MPNEPYTFGCIIYVVLCHCIITTQILLYFSVFIKLPETGENNSWS